MKLFSIVMLRVMHTPDAEWTFQQLHHKLHAAIDLTFE